MELIIYREECENKQKHEDFYLTLDCHLDEENMSPRRRLKKVYKEMLSDSGIGTPVKSVRMAHRALINKEKSQISNREII
ncbi:hypothetical protein [Oceanispirochaeta sp. M1]|uniref:hypothetical protein n=1 Tax=Oceanispirochaeta sp. M1 TaxID=2283433 RepID=UPI0013145748|nr:hypothetical protein [Oceanispirochaeta sp. M1]NPD75112.1 hypothetical protein [Oceanispirochaeta sp. M1]